MEANITYFDKPGPANTEATLRLSYERANTLGISQVVLASTTGDTALKAMDAFLGLKVIAVGIATGPRFHDKEKKIVQSFSQEARRLVEEKGGKILISTHVFGGITRALYNDLDWKANPISLISAALRAFGTGMKVACEITMMATDAGLLDTNEDAIAIAGSGHGADTAIVLRPVNSTLFFQLRVKEIICKPRLG
jgi:hypothetical protein